MRLFGSRWRSDYGAVNLPQRIVDRVRSIGSHIPLVILTLLLAPSLALAQSTVLQGGPWVPGHVGVYGPGTSQPIIIDGGPARGGGLGVGVSELGITAQGVGVPPFVGQGTGPNGTNNCMYDAPITNAAGYHFLCFSANATISSAQGGQIVYGAGGIASALPLSVCVNGVCNPIGGVASGLIVNSTAVSGGTNGDILGIGTGGNAGKLVDTGIASSSLSGAPYLPLSGGTMAGPIAMGGNAITGIGNLTLTPASASLNGLTVIESPAGTVSSTFNFINGINISNWNVNAGSDLAAAVGVQTLINGANAQAGNAMLGFMSDVDWYADAGVNNKSSYTGIIGLGRVKGSPTGTNFVMEGVNGNVAIDAGKVLPTGGSLVGIESDVTAASGSLVGTTTRRAGYQLTLGPTDAAQATDADAGILFNTTTSNTNTLGWVNGWLLDFRQGQIISTTGCVVCAYVGSTPTVSKGIDISNLTITGNAWASPSASISGAGGATFAKLGVGVAAPSAVLAQFHGGTNANVVLLSGTSPTLEAINDALNARESLVIQATTLTLDGSSGVTLAASENFTIPSGGLILGAVAPTVSSNQIGYGSTVAAATSCGSLSGAAGCIVVNIAGTPHYVPYY